MAMAGWAAASHLQLDRTGQTGVLSRASEGRLCRAVTEGGRRIFRTRSRSYVRRGRSNVAVARSTLTDCYTGAAGKSKECCTEFPRATERDPRYDCLARWALHNGATSFALDSLATPIYIYSQCSSGSRQKCSLIECTGIRD